MKIIGLLTAMIFVLATGLATVEAKPYKALTKGVGSPVEIPDETVLPDYMARLEYAETILYFGTLRAANFYKDPEFRYLKEDGEEIFPYAEIVKKEGDSLHLFGLFFINNKNVLEFYADGENSNSPPTGKLKKFIPQKEDRVTKTPRIK